jgi:hypothetical protein
MGRKGRNKSRRQTETFSSDEDSNDGRNSGNRRQEGQLGSYAVSARESTHQLQNRNTNQRPREPLHSRVQSRPLPTNNSNVRSFNHNDLLYKSRRFKQQFLQSIDQTIKQIQQIQQWYPDEDSSEDQMDWQPEVEIILPPPVERVVDTISAWESGLKTQMSSSYVGPALLVKAHMNAVPPLGRRAMRRASIGHGYDSVWEQRMEREMNKDMLSSVPRSCKYAVPATLLLEVDLG